MRRPSPIGIFVLKFFTEMGVALGKGRLLRLHPTSDGVEIRLAAAARIPELRAMVALAGLARSP